MRKLSLKYNRQLCLIFLLVICFSDQRDVCADVLQGKVRHVRYGFTIQNMKSSVLPLGELWFYAPAENTSWQQCLLINVSRDYEVILDEAGNRIVHLSFEDMPPYATEIVTVEAQLQFADQPRIRDKISLEQYLQPERYIESDHAEIIRLAHKLKKETSLETAKNIHNWVAKNINYAGYMKHPRGALYALRNKKGDCTEYMMLFTALCRANNIPARGIGGYVCSRDCILRPADYHNWAEFYQDGAWRIADPQKKLFMQNETHYIAMRVMTQLADHPMKKHFRYRFDGDGLIVKMNKN